MYGNFKFNCLCNFINIMFYNILLAIGLLIFLALGLSFFIAGKIIRVPRELRHEEWKKYDLHPENIHFNSSDGIKLAGIFIKGNLDATIILLHGYGRSKEQMLPQAAFLHKAGFNILMFDFRASGESEGKYITFGVKEKNDLEGAVSYLKTRKDINPEKIGLLGFSMGGAVAIMESGELPEIKAIVINSSYARFKTVIWNNFKIYLKGVPFFPLGWIVLLIIKSRTGIYYPRINPIKYLEKLQKRPLMIIHGTHDKRIPVEDTMEFYKKAPWIKEFWLVKGAGHEDTYSIKSGEYEEKVINFFKKNVL